MTKFLPCEYVNQLVSTIVRWKFERRSNADWSPPDQADEPKVLVDPEAKTVEIVSSYGSRDHAQVVPDLVFVDDDTLVVELRESERDLPETAKLSLAIRNNPVRIEVEFDESLPETASVRYTKANGECGNRDELNVRG